MLSATLTHGEKFMGVISTIGSLFLTLMCLHATGIAQTRESDSLALRDLFQACNGSAWKTSTNWNSDRPLEEWYGIKCDSVSGRVTRIDLEANGLEGELPPSLTSMTSLTALSLSSNQISGALPLDIGSLIELTLLRLSGNMISGTIPASIGTCTKLIGILLTDNNMFGEIPPEMGQLEKLSTLNMPGNALTGTIPASFVNLKSLRVLNLGTNELSGEFPDVVYQLDSVSTLVLGRNNFTGELSPRIGGLIRLSNLDLRHNNLTGRIPTELRNCKRLQTLNLEFNAFDGEIPPELCELTNLSMLDLTSNKLTGSIPDSIGSLVRLLFLQLDQNALTGSFPVSMKNLARVRGIYAHQNKLTGGLENFPDKNLDSVSINNNAFDFFALLRSNVQATVLPYSPQDSVGVSEVQPLTSGQQLRIPCGTRHAEGNVYEWSRNGEVLLDQADSILIVDGVSQADAGVYACAITNARFFLLTLHRRPVVVTVDGPSTVGSQSMSTDLVSPSPVIETMIINLDEQISMPCFLTVTDIHGACVFRTTLTTPHLQLPREGIASGHYVVTVANSRTSRSQSILVMR